MFSEILCVKLRMFFPLSCDMHERSMKVNWVRGCWMWVHGALSVQYGGLDCWMWCGENVDERAYYFFLLEHR